MRLLFPTLGAPKNNIWKPFRTRSYKEESDVTSFICSRTRFSSKLPPKLIVKLYI